MKNLFLLLILLPAFVSAQVTEDWVSPDDYYGKDGIRVAVDADDNAFTVSDIFNGDIYLTKRSMDGSILWSTGYDNTAPSQWEVASDVTIDLNGDAIVTGYTNTGFGSDWYPYQMVTMKFNGEDGVLLWRKTYNTGSYYRGRRVLTDAAGNIYVGGDVNAWMVYHGEVGNMMVKKYDTDGNEIWSVIQNELGSSMPGPLKTMKFDNTGNLIIAGYNTSMAKITADGNVEWSTTSVGGGVTDISVDADGNIYALYSAAFGTPFSTTDIVVKKFSNTGSVLWSNHFDFGGEEFGQQIECDNVGGAFIIGYGTSGGYFDWITFRIDNIGNQLWSQIYNEHAANDEIPRMMAKDNDDNIYVTGQGGPWPGYFWTSLTQMVTIKYTPDGVEEWVALHTLYTNTGSAICLASDNSIYAVGQMYAVTIHYTQATPLVCDIPTGLFTNNITTTKAKLNWAISPDAFQYEVWYKKATAANWKKKFVPGINNKLNLKNLVCNTNYVWKIRTVCDTVGTDLISDFSPDQLFTTAPCREEEIAREDNISIYPNPATDRVQINVGELTITGIRIIDLTGKVADAGFENIGGTIQLNLTHLPAGTYIISIQTPDTIINTQMIIIK